MHITSAIQGSSVHVFLIFIFFPFNLYILGANSFQRILSTVVKKQGFFNNILKKIVAKLVLEINCIMLDAS